MENDAQSRRESLRESMRSVSAEQVAEQTPNAGEEVETIDEIFNQPATPAAAAEEEVVEEAASEELEEEVEAAEAEEAESEEEQEEEEPAAEAEAEPEAEVPEEITSDELTLLNHRSEVFDSLVEALDETDYPIPALAGQTEEEIAQGVQELSNRLADAHAVYSILDGKGAEGIFERVKKFQGQEAHDYALRAVLAYAEKVGLIESTGAPAPGKKPAAGVADTGETPKEKALREDNEKLRREAGQRRSADAETQLVQRRTAVALAAVTAAENYAKELKMSDEDFKEFVMPQMRGLGHNKAIFNRCSRNNFVDLIQIVDRVQARLTGKRVTAGNERVERRKIRDTAFPKRVAGVETRRPAERSRDLSTSEGRRAAAKAALRG